MRQTGGRGQYGDVWIKLEPQTTGGGFEFIDAVKGGGLIFAYYPDPQWLRTSKYLG